MNQNKKEDKKKKQKDEGEENTGTLGLIEGAFLLGEAALS